MPGKVRKIVRAAEGVHAVKREQVQVDREYVQQHDPEPVGRQCVADRGQNRDHLVGDAVLLDGRENADRNGDHDRRGESRAHEKHRRGNALDDLLQDRPAIGE